jgi:hypothetical protein
MEPKLEKEKIETVYLAIREESTWDRNKQIAFTGTWSEVVREAKRISKEAQKEVRVSNSFGFNNQGHYFHYSNC